MKREKIYQVVTGVLVGGLILALGGGYALYRFANATYRQLNNVALDPLNLDYYLRVPEEVNVEDRQVVVFFGDSRAEQWVRPAMSSDFIFVNRGIGAQTSAQVVGRFEAHVTPVQPDVIVIQVCINDLKTIPLFPERKQRIIDQCENNIAEIVAKSQAIGATVIMTTVMPAGKIPLARRLVWSEEVGLAVAEVNEFIRGLEGVIVLDAWQLVGDNAGILRPEYSIDELHLNEAGYEVLNQALEKALETLHE